MLKIDTRDLDRLDRDLEKVRRKAIPHAVRDPAAVGDSVCRISNSKSTKSSPTRPPCPAPWTHSVEPGLVRVEGQTVVGRAGAANPKR